MKALLLFELRKLLKQSSTYIWILAFLASAVVGSIIAYYVPGGIFFQGSTQLTLSSIMTSAIAPVLSYPIFFMLLCIYDSLYCNSDNNNGTVKNIYSKGYSREKHLFSKYIISLIYIFINTILCFVISFVVGLILLHSTNGLNTDLIINLLLEIMIVITMHTFYFAVSARMKNGSIAVTLMASIFMPLLLSLFELFFQMSTANFHFYYLFPLGILIYSPYMALSTGMIIATILCNIAYFALFIPLCYFATKRREF